MALVMSRSATRGSSLAFVSVVSMRSWAKRFAARFRNMARRWLVFRPNLRPAFQCRMGGSARRGLVGVLLGLPALEHLGPAVDLHPERQPHAAEDFLDLFERLSPEIVGLQHVLLVA